MKKYIFNANKKLDIERLALATLKRVHSFTVVPRVLINSCLDDFIKFTNGTIFLCQINLAEQKFKRYVHYKNYDLGLFFLKKDGKQFVKIIDGTGQFACTHTINIFLDFFIQDKIQLKISKKNLKNLYKTPKNTQKLADLRF